MKVIVKAVVALTISLAAVTSIAAGEGRDCMLEGTLLKDGSGEEQSVNVKFHSVSKYDDSSKCNVRRGEKMQFKLPDDPRLKEAEPGSPVKYRYRTDNEGKARTELISVGT